MLGTLAIFPGMTPAFPFEYKDNNFSQRGGKVPENFPIVACGFRLLYPFLILIL